MNNNPIIITAVVAVAAVALMVGYVAGRRTWRNTARQKMERAAGGVMSPAALASFERRDRRSEPWNTGGILLGLAGLPITTALDLDAATAIYLMLIPISLGTAIGHVVAALTPLSDQLPQRRLASLTPRDMSSYVSRSRLRGGHIALALPAIAVSLGALALFDPTSPRAQPIGLIAMGAISLGLGLVAPSLRHRLLEVPNPADTVEIAYWNNTIVSRAICDLTETMTFVSLMSGVLAVTTLTGPLVIPLLPFAGRMILFGALFLIGGVAFLASFGGGITSAVPTFIRLHQPGMGRHA